MNKKIFQRVAKTMFSVAGDLKTTVTFTDVVEGTYVAATDIQVDTESTKDVDAIVGNYLRKELTDGIRQTDMRCRILATDINTLTVLPRLNDNITIDTLEFNIVDITVDMADAVWIFQLRE